MSTERRRAALVSAFPADVDAMLVTKLVNVRYLTGFTGSNAAVLVVRDGDAMLATDGRYQVQAAAEAPDVRLYNTKRLGPALLMAASAAGSRRVGIERHDLTLTAFDVLRAATDSVSLVDVGRPVESLRVVKDADEISALRRACEATDAAFADVLGRLRPGVTEQDIEWLLLSAMRAAGAEASAFDPIVAFGANSAEPHHRPTGRRLERGDLVKLDFGARVEGYHADMTRTVVCGSPYDWQRDLHASVLDVQRRCCEATVQGAAVAEIDGLARRLTEQHGQPLVHGLGHGVGLEIHEDPFLMSGTEAPPLARGVPVTVEPGIYLPGKGGVRIEDTVLVGEQAPESLTRSPRELVSV